MSWKMKTANLLLAAVVTTCGAAACGRGDSGEEHESTPEKIVTVEVQEVVAQRVEDWLDLPGKIEPFQVVTVSSEVGGILDWIGADEGDYVKKGQKLAVINRENLELKERQAVLALEQARIRVEQARIAEQRTRASLESADAGERRAEATLAQSVELERKAVAMMEESARDLDRGRALFEERLTPRSRLDELEMAFEAASADLASTREGIKAARAALDVVAAEKRAVAAGLMAAGEDRAAAQSLVKTAEAGLEEARLFLRKSIISSPLEGYLDLKHFEAGELLKDQDPLFRIVQTRPAKAVFHLPEKDVPFLKQGMEATVTVDAHSPLPVAGRVTLVGVTSDPATSTYRLEVDLPNKSYELRPGMLARLKLLRQGLDEELSVPVFAVITGEAGSAVFTYSNGVARRREVTTGILDGDRLQITGGLAPGDLVIVKGQRDLEEGQKVALP